MKSVQASNRANEWGDVVDDLVKIWQKNAGAMRLHIFFVFLTTRMLVLFGVILRSRGWAKVGKAVPPLVALGFGRILLISHRSELGNDLGIVGRAG